MVVASRLLIAPCEHDVGLIVQLITVGPPGHFPPDPGAPAILRSRLISLFPLQYAVIGGQAAIFSLLNYGGGGFFD